MTIQFFVFCLLSYAQKPNDDVNLKKFHPEYLQQLIEKKINDFREENEVQVLENEHDLQTG